MTFQDALHLVLSVLGIFSVIIIITRIFGLRTFTKITSFDFASTIAVGSVLAFIILTKDSSFLIGGIALTAIFGLQALFFFLIRNVEPITNLFASKPQIILLNGQNLEERLKICNIGKDILLVKLIETNVQSLYVVKAVIFEITGNVSVIQID